MFGWAKKLVSCFSDAKSEGPIVTGAVVTDNQYLTKKRELVDRAKTIQAWSSVSRIFGMVSAALFPTAMTMLITGIANPASAVVAPVLIGMFAASAACVAISIAADYIATVISSDRGLDMTDVVAKRNATHLATALKANGKDDLANGKEEPYPQNERTDGKIWGSNVPKPALNNAAAIQQRKALASGADLGAS